MGTYDSLACHNRKFVAHKRSLPAVSCKCGSEILVTPDLKVTNRAIRNHLAEHKQEGDGSDRLDSLEQFLAEQVLIVASKINLQTIGEGRLPVNKNPKYPKGTKGHEATP